MVNGTFPAAAPTMKYENYEKPRAKDLRGLRKHTGLFDRSPRAWRLPWLVPGLPVLAARCRFPAGHSPPEGGPSAEGTIAGKSYAGSLRTTDCPVVHCTASNMKPPSELNITIPASIVALPDLNLIEKAILSRIHERPACSNGGLAKITGLSLRGTEATLVRLKKRELIRSSGHGHARRLWLTFLVEHHTECGKDRNENAHMECGLAAKVECLSAGGIQPDDLTSIEFLKKELSALISSLLAGDFNQARANHDRIRRWYSALCEKAPYFRTQANEFVQGNGDCVLVFEACWSELNTLPCHERGQLAKLLFRASPERLTQIRQQVEIAKGRGDRVDLKRLIGA